MVVSLSITSRYIFHLQLPLKLLLIKREVFRKLWWKSLKHEYWEFFIYFNSLNRTPPLCNDYYLNCFLTTGVIFQWGRLLELVFLFFLQTSVNMLWIFYVFHTAICLNTEVIFFQRIFRTPFLQLPWKLCGKYLKGSYKRFWSIAI